ncbi:Sodium/hydrogen exchanger family protein [Sphingobium faniae]|nr:Sodium/hydrogen exchanger family protein [Sphingobium faniae]
MASPASVAALSATDVLLSEGVILLGAAVFFVILFRRFGLGAVLGYLIAGALVGPQGLGLVGGGESKLAIAEIGIVLLLFLVGLELHPARLWRLKRDIFALGLAQVVLCGLALTGIIFYSTGFKACGHLRDSFFRADRIQDWRRERHLGSTRIKRRAVGAGSPRASR